MDLVEYQHDLMAGADLAENLKIFVRGSG